MSECCIFWVAHCQHQKRFSPLFACLAHQTLQGQQPWLVLELDCQALHTGACLSDCPPAHQSYLTQVLKTWSDLCSLIIISWKSSTLPVLSGYQRWLIQVRCHHGFLWLHCKAISPVVWRQSPCQSVVAYSVQPPILHWCWLSVGHCMKSRIAALNGTWKCFGLVRLMFSRALLDCSASPAFWSCVCRQGLTSWSTQPLAPSNTREESKLMAYLTTSTVSCWPHPVLLLKLNFCGGKVLTG